MITSVPAADVKIGDEISVWGRFLPVTAVTDDMIVAAGQITLARVGNAMIRRPDAVPLAARFVAVHAWMPLADAMALAEAKIGERFCDACADWHEEDEDHSQP